MQKIETINCYNCNKEVTKRAAELKRRRKYGKTKFYCDNICAAIKSNIETKRPGNSKVLIPDNLRDQYTPFRWFLARARQRKKKGPTDLDVDYLKELWESQSGICIFTGWELLLPASTEGWINGADIKNASLDRIDNKLGYIKGNVRFISVMANICRGAYLDEAVFKFCDAVTKHASSKYLL